MRLFSLAHISDAHIKAHGKLSYGKVDTLGALTRCIHHINGMKPRPDAVVISGDLVDFGLTEEYVSGPV